MAPAAAAWLRAARRTAEGRKDSAAYWEVAWEATEAWWLRPLAFTVSALVTVGAILQQPDRFRRVQPKPAVESLEALEQARKESTDAKARKALSGLQRMELPFFGTSASWSNRLNGVVVSGNPREGAIQNWQMSEEVLRQSVESELGYPVFLHLLRRAEEEQGELSRPYELLVRDASRTSEGAGAMMAPLISLAAVWWCSTQLDSNTSLQQLGAVIQPGSGTRWHLTLGLVLLGELARTVVASMNGVSIGARTFLPSPQFGLIGVFAPADSASPNRSAALATSLAAPVVVAVSSLLLALGAGLFPDMVSLKTSSLVGSPLAFLPEEMSAAGFAATQGLLMSALALLPQSPDGRAAWSVVVGREKAKRLSDTASYVYPLLGVLSMWCFGNGFLTLPFTWALLLTNLTPRQPPPPLEEASEPSESERGVAMALLVTAAVAAAPLPWAQLLQLLVA